jgi:hypothetical protein
MFPELREMKNVQKKWPNTIKSDEGFSVKILGRTQLKYTEDTKNMTVEIEMLAIAGISLFKDSVQNWAPPNDTEPITEDKRNEIIGNICRAMDFYGWKTDVIDRLIFRQRTGENS